MPEQMMRMAGRGTDGLAKALETDLRGRLNTKTSLKRTIGGANKLVTPGDAFKTTPRWTEGYLFGRLVVRLFGTRNLKISIINIAGDDSEEEARTIFEGQATSYLVVDYDLTAERYVLLFEATTPGGYALRADTYELLHNTPMQKEAKNGALPEINFPNKMNQRPIKYPTNTLDFKDVPVDIKVMTKGSDGYFYVIDSQNRLKKYNSLVDDSEPIETGVTLGGGYGTYVYLFVDSNGVVIFSNYWNGTHQAARIHRANSIHDQPTLVYENQSASSVSPIWSSHFGVSHYTNGRETFYLAGEYGNPSYEHQNASRNLVLSTDGGRTFKVVKKTSTNDVESVNSHWHDTAIDVYHGLLWASEGDGTNAGIYYSADFGDIWTKLSEKQPTSIIPYPNKILFGRDQDEVGFDQVIFPENILDLPTSEVETGKIFSSQSAYQYFARKPIVDGSETYQTFNLYSNAETPMIVASGDSGESWHGVYMGFLPTDIRNFVAIDDEHLYAYTANGVVYSKRVEWE